ncbi:BQ5605_C004g02894 [Microbotryum silenes-dioicae]|uniref:BQ5605_C004g02894 protein n=1 Tax=Microbotryum silenes-dioicae TaxID=796604 RepID=A0A2X0N363_9BASI|nr:BQ5605_C004g02894 [Microbotryum silenes-dioicae]
MLDLATVVPPLIADDDACSDECSSTSVPPHGPPPSTITPPPPTTSTLGPLLAIAPAAVKPSTGRDHRLQLIKLQAQLSRALLRSKRSSAGGDDTPFDFDEQGDDSDEGLADADRHGPELRSHADSHRRASSFEPSTWVPILPTPPTSTIRRSSTPRTLRRPVSSSGDASSWPSRLSIATASSSGAERLEPLARLVDLAPSPPRSDTTERWANRVFTNSVLDKSVTSLPRDRGSEPSPLDSPCTPSVQLRQRLDEPITLVSTSSSPTSTSSTNQTSMYDNAAGGALPFPVSTGVSTNPESVTLSASITRNSSSPPVHSVPPSTGLTSPIHLMFTPPSATQSIPSWPASPSSPLFYAMPEHSCSAPLLSLACAVECPLDANVLPETPVRSSSEKDSEQEAEEESRHSKRFHSLLELVDTEALYLEHLRVLVKVYFHTLPFLTLLSVDQLRTVIRNGEAVLELHERIGTRIEEVERELDWRRIGQQYQKQRSSQVAQAAGRISQIFLDEVSARVRRRGFNSTDESLIASLRPPVDPSFDGQLPNFLLYNQFCAGYVEAADVVNSLKDTPEWETFERQCSSHAGPASPSISSGEQTPVAATAQSPFFPPSPPSSSSRVSTAIAFSHPSSLVTLNAPSTSSAAGSASAVASAARSRLRYADYAITPVQRICRYPLVFSQVLKHLPPGPAYEVMRSARDGLHIVAEGVDAAQRARAGEIRTKIVATRMEFLAPANAAFCDVLGPTLLVGSLHVLHRSHSADSGLRVKYFGCFLYRSHLIIGKIKKRDSYEPREWLPLRLFDIVDLPDGEAYDVWSTGALLYSIRLSCREHTFELGSTCVNEKAIWLERLLAAKTEAHRAWDSQELDSQGLPTLFDETLVSSLVAVTPSTTQKRSHSRTNSGLSLPGLYERSPTSVTTEDSPTFSETGPIPHTATSFNHVSMSSTMSSRNRFSSTASALLGKSSAASYAAIDLRLADVFSQDLTQARILAGRTRSAFGPRRSMTSQVGSLSDKERRRMSSFDPMGLSRTSHVGDPDTAYSPVLSSAFENRNWSTSLRKSKSGSANNPSAFKSSRPMLAEIDTLMSPPLKKLGSWKGKAVRRASSHSSLHSLRGMSAITPTTPSAATAASAVKASTTAGVDRQNSVSSSTSGTNSSESHGTTSNTGSAGSTETPPSSIPPSPDYRDHLDLRDFDERLFAINSSHGMKSGQGSGSRRMTSTLGDVLKLRRRSSAFLLGSTQDDDPSSRDPYSRRETLQEPNNLGPSSLQRRASAASHKIGDFFSKRAHSTPSLAQFFAGGPNPNPVSSSYSAPSRLAFKSTPDLELPSAHEASGEATQVANTLSPVSSRSSASTPPGSVASSPVPPKRSSFKPSSKTANSSTSPNALGLFGNRSASRFQSQFRLTPMP